MKLDIETKRVASGHRIFLIDPDMVSRSALYFMISDVNEIHEFESVSEIAGMDATVLPDLVIVNATLVARHGKGLIQGWRILWPQARLLMICEGCEAACIIAAKAAGADDTLQRPFDRDEIRQKVERWVDQPVELHLSLVRKDNALHVRH